MAAPVISSATYAPSTGYLTIVWDQAVDFNGGAGAITYQLNTASLYENTGSIVSGNGTTSTVFQMAISGGSTITAGTLSIEAAAFGLHSPPYTGNVAVANQAVTVSGGALCTLAQVKTHLGITATTYDTILTAMINAAERQLGLWCDRRDESSGMSSGNAVSMWLSGTHTEKRPGALKETITARYWPVTSITSVIVYSSGSSSYTLGTYLYRIDDDQRTIRYMGQQAIAWDAGLIPADYPFNVAPIQTERAYPYTQITYAGGFTAGSVPPELSQAAMELVKFIFNARGRDWSLVSENLGDYSYTTLAGMMAEYREMFINLSLKPYLGIGGGVV